LEYAQEQIMNNNIRKQKMKKVIALSLLIVAGTSVAEEMRPIEKLTYLGDAYRIVCEKKLGGSYKADEALGKKTDYLQYWTCTK